MSNSNHKPKMVFVNQVCGYLFIDVLNVFATKYNCHLYTGKIIDEHPMLNKAVKINLLNQYKCKNILQRLFSWLLFSFSAFIKLLFVTPNTQLFVVTNPPFNTFMAYCLFKLKGIKYHLLVYDVYPEALVTHKLIRKNSFLNRLWTNYNFKIYHAAATIITISNAMAGQILKYDAALNVHVIPNWANKITFTSIVPTNPFIANHNLLNKFCVLYSGNMGATHHLECIISVAHELLPKQNIQFLFVGHGPQKRSLIDICNRKKITNCLFIPYQPVHLFPYTLQAAAIGIVSTAPGIQDLSLPSKTYNLLAAGKALLVIASPNSELAKLVEEQNCGRHFEPTQILSIQNYIKLLSTDAQLLNFYRSNALLAAKKFTSQNAFQYLNLI